ncbi:MAG: prepilin peptidase [Deltaproteobacteria bacterium]|nr:prepilin peptidase [Deltaproteobacteria bacterium]
MSLSFSQLLTSPLTWVVFVFGSIFGSFFNVCIYRIPRGNFFQSHRSFCPHCQTPIPFWLNIPLLSFIILRGRTHCCRQPLSWQYPIVELLAAILLVIVFWRFPFLRWQEARIVWNGLEGIRFLHAALFTSLLLIISVIDFHHMIIPDSLSISMIAATPVVILVHPELNWMSGMMGAIMGAAVVYLIAWLYILIRRREGIGMGDAKLLAAMGGWLGVEALFPIFLYGSVTGSLVGIGLLMAKRTMNLQTELPFGPFLAFGATLHLLLPLHWHELVYKLHTLVSPQL